MAVLAIPNTFANGTNADGTQVNANFTAVATFCNNEAIQRDASVAFTGIPSLPGTDPTAANQAVRKQYVDNFIPAGVIVDFAGSTAPSGWVFCDGTLYDGNVATYARLWAAIGTTYGGTGISSYAVPNTKGRVRVGRDTGQTEFDALGETGGAKTHTLTAAEMPTHTHVQDAHNHTLTDPQHAHGDSSALGDWLMTDIASSSGNLDLHDGGGSLGYGTTSATAAASTGITLAAATATNQNAGGGGAHNNLQPYLVVNQIIKL